MFPGGYRPDYARRRASKPSSATTAAAAAGSPRSASPPFSRAVTSSTTTTDVVSAAALTHSSQVSESHGQVHVSTDRVDTKFALPPALITCLVRHIDSQHNILATPAIVERCLHDLQLRLMPWVPVERVFGATMRATAPARSAVGSTAAASTSFSPTAGSATPGGGLSASHAGTYLAGSHVRLQLAKTTDTSVVVAVGASVLHLLFYAVNEPESRPSHLVHIVQEWMEALKTKGEEHDCMVLLVHSDLVTASETAARMAEEAQKAGAVAEQPPPRPGASTPPPPSAAATTSAPAPIPPAVSQDKVDAAAAQLRKYYKELEDLKIPRQQVSAYVPNETPTRILQRLRPAVIARGGRLRQALQIAAARKRQFPQDPSTKPVPLSGASPPSQTTNSTPAAPFSSNSAPESPPPPSSPRPAGGGGGGGDGGNNAKRASLSTAGTAAAAASAASITRRASSYISQPAPSSVSQQQPQQFFNIQALWRTGYDLVVHYLQYGLVFDARETLEHLYLEYYNNSDDFVFLRTPTATLERLGRVPNLFETHGQGGWEIGRTGYPKALEPGAELLEGLLLLASAEMTCSLLLGEGSAATTRYNTFVQVAREKFEEWSTLEAKAKLQLTTAAPSSLQSSPPQQAHGAEGSVTSSTYQQFFLLQCYLSGLRMWWSTSGLCRPRRVPSPRGTPTPETCTQADNVVGSPGAAAGPPEEAEGSAAGESPQSAAAAGQSLTNAASLFSATCLPPLKIVTPTDTAAQATLPAPEVDAEDDSVAVALCDSPLLLPAPGDAAAVVTALSAPTFTTTYVTSSSPRGDGEAVSAPAAAAGAALESSTALNGDSGVRYSITNPSFAASGGTSFSGLSFRGVGSFAGRPQLYSGERVPDAAPLLVPHRAASSKYLDEMAKEGEGSAAGSGIHSIKQLQLEDSRDDGTVRNEDEEEELISFELNYLMEGSEDTVQVSAGYLVELAVSTGLVAPTMEPEELRATAETICDAVEAADVVLVRELLQQQLRLRRRCTEAASLLEHARDSLAAVAHDLGYSPFSRVVGATSFGRDVSGQESSGVGEGCASNDAAATTTTTAFSNVEELSSPTQALRLWRILTAMAALTLHIGNQRRREFHLYTRLAVTFLADHPMVTAKIVEDRLLPYVKTRGWSHVELFVRRLYVEARERLICQAGLSGDIAGGIASPAEKHSSNASSTDTEGKGRKLQAKVWPRIFRTGAAYALYRECILVLISSDYGNNNDSGKSRGEDTLNSSSLPPADRAAKDGVDAQPQQQQQQQASARTTLTSPISPSTPYAAAGIYGEDAVGSLDTRLFAHRSKSEWWRELLRVDALVMNAFYAGEPPEYPLNTLFGPLLVRLEKQQSSSAVTTASLNAVPFPSPATGVLKVCVDEVVRLSFAMSCPVNPLMGPGGELHLRLTSPSTPQLKSKSAHAVRIQLTLESRKDWSDEEELTHVVHIHNCEDAVYDEATQQLCAVFLFSVCHAGVYRVRRIRLCSGKTWLAYYPQQASVSSTKNNSSDWRGGHRGLQALLSRSGAVLPPRESAPASRMRAVSDASFQPVTHAAVLQVPEPRSSVHLKVTLPEEAHCFADSVDYLTLDVDLEDPLSLAVSSGCGAGQQPSAASFSRSTDKSGADARRPDAAAVAAAGGEEAENEENSNSDEGAACTCVYEAGPENLLLPLSVPAVSASGRRGRRAAETSVREDVIELGSQQRVSSVSPGYRALLSNSNVNDGAGTESVGGLSDGLRARGPSPVAAVVLSTPNVYRQKGIPSSTSPAGASMRTSLGASLSHFANSYILDVGAASAACGGGGDGVAGLGDSFPRYRRLPSPHQSLHATHHSHHHLSRRATPADAHLSSSIRFASCPMGTSPPAIGSTAAAASASASSVGSVSRTANSSGLRYKSVFKSLRISAKTPEAATATMLNNGTEHSPASASTRSAPTVDRHRAMSAHGHQHEHHQQQLRACWHPHYNHLYSPTTSEPSAHEGVGGEDSLGWRVGGQSMPATACLSGGVGGGGGGASSPLREVDPDTFELVLTHPANQDKDGDTKSTAAAASSTSSSKAASLATTAVARTSVPIHLGAFLNSIPPPEVQTQVPNTVSSPEVKHAAETAATLGPLLQAVSSRTASTDHLRESVIRLFPSNSILQGTAAGNSASSSASTSPAAVTSAAATTTTTSGQGDKAGVTRVSITQMRLRVPLLPLLVTPASSGQTKTADADGAAGRDSSPVSDNSNKTKNDAPANGNSASSSAEAAKQARIMFTCLRGREPSTTSLSVVIPFQLAVSFDYAFKHFQGRVYCLVRMRNLLKSTSLWMRGAVLRVLDPEPSYEIVRVCNVYNELLLTEWKPQEELSILYELDLIASFHPVQPECAHQVQMQLFYSSWEKSYVPTPAEDRLVLRTVELPSTEATAESVELIHGDEDGSARGGLPSSPSSSAPAARLLSSNSSSALRTRTNTLHMDGSLERMTSETTPNQEDKSALNSTEAPLPSGRGGSSPTLTKTRTATLTTFGGSDLSDGSVTRSATQVAHSHHSSSSSSSRSDRGSSSVTNSEAVHFNIVTLRHLEETCNAVLGPVATFHSKHLCVFNIVMYAESPWTMRFGAATNYVARAPPSPLSTPPPMVLDGVERGLGGAREEEPLPRSSQAPSRANPPPPLQSLSNSIVIGSQSGAGSVGGSGVKSHPRHPPLSAPSASSFFGNAMVDQPSDFIFVAGEPVRFCVRLQPLAQNWPEDANMEETFFIRLKYNPTQWMVIGKQRDRRTLSLMEEVTVYFNAVPLLPRASADDTENGLRSLAAEKAGGSSAGEGGVRRISNSNNNNDKNTLDEADDENENEGSAALLSEDEQGKVDEVGGGTTALRASRPLAGHAVRDEGILQTPTVEMFWERKKPEADTTATGATGGGAETQSLTVAEAAPPSAHGDAVMGEAVLIDVVQFRTWVRVRKRGH